MDELLARMTTCPYALAIIRCNRIHNLEWIGDLDGLTSLWLENLESPVSQSLRLPPGMKSLVVVNCDEDTIDAVTPGYFEKFADLQYDDDSRSSLAGNIVDEFRSLGITLDFHPGVEAWARFGAPAEN